MKLKKTWRHETIKRSYAKSVQFFKKKPRLWKKLNLVCSMYNVDYLVGMYYVCRYILHMYYVYRRRGGIRYVCMRMNLNIELLTGRSLLYTTQAQHRTFFYSRVHLCKRSAEVWKKNSTSFLYWAELSLSPLGFLWL